jgi:hypothetical protein
MSNEEDSERSVGTELDGCDTEGGNSVGTGTVDGLENASRKMATS